MTPETEAALTFAREIRLHVEAELRTYEQHALGGLKLGQAGMVWPSLEGAARARAKLHVLDVLEQALRGAASVS